MTQHQFLDYIYAIVKPGMEVVKPRKISEILKVTDQGDIFYRIGQNNHKAVTRTDLINLYQALRKGELTDKVIRAIAGPSRPCNKTTIDWLVVKLNLRKLVSVAPVE